MSEAAKLIRGPIRGHLVTQTLPMIFGVAAVMSIGLVDAYFIGQLGSAELAAIAFIFPVSVALASLGVGVSVGINSVVARALGAGENDRSHALANFGILCAIGLGAAMGVAMFALIDPLFALMQAPAELMPLIRVYMQPFSVAFPLLMVIMGINGVLRGQGEAKRTSAISLTYAAINWILDPILITGAFGFEGFGMAGAAYATLAGYAVAVALGFFLLGQTALPFRPSLATRANWASSIKSLAKVAGPAAFSNAINPIGLTILTALVATQGQAAVAGFGAAGRLQSFGVVPLLAMSGSIGGIVGQNWGAGQYNRAREAMAWAGGFCVLYGLALAAVLFAAGDWFAGFFTDDPAVISEFSSYLSIAAWGYAGYGLLIVSNGALNAVDRATWALAQSFVRVFLIMMPVAWLLRPVWGSQAIYAAELAANALGGLVAAFIVWRLLRSKRDTAHAAS